MAFSADIASLTVDLSHGFTPVVLDFAEGCGRSFGLGDRDTMSVRLATEEVFEYLCQTAKDKSRVTVEAVNNLYEMKIVFLFKPRTFDPYAFNLTADVDLAEGHTENLGLLIASRSVDRFSIRHGRHDGLALSLVKEKSYPPATDDRAETTAPLDDVAIVVPDSETAKRFSRTGASHYDTVAFPTLFRSPARMADILTKGDYHLRVATGKGTRGAEVGGGILWRGTGKSMIQFHGPYLFRVADTGGVARMLVESFLTAIAKSDAVGAFGLFPDSGLVDEYFEPLGTISYARDDGAQESHTFSYRLLKEDPGTHVWADKSLEPFLEETFGRLFLPREVMRASFDGEHLPPHSVFSVKSDRSRGAATIRAVWDGADYRRNVAQHVELLKKEGLKNIFMDLDLGLAWQAKLAPALLEEGFAPVMILPYAGGSDTVLFQLKG